MSEETTRTRSNPPDPGHARPAGEERAAAADRGTGPAPASRDTELRLRAIFDHTFQFIGLLDPDGVVLEANRSALEFGGLTREEVVGRPFWETGWWREASGDADRVRAAIGRAAAGEFVRYEAEVSGSGGRTLTIDFSLNPVRDGAGRVVLLVPEGRDIGDARRAERDLRISREKYAAIVATSADAIVTIDEAQRITDFNHGAESIFGWTAAEAVGQPLDLLLPPQYRGAHRQHVHRFGESEVTARRMGERQEIAGLRKSGEVFPADASISKLDVGGGRIYTVVLRDITLQKRAESVQSFLARAGGLLAASLDVPTVYAGVSQLAVEFAADCCEIFEVDESDRVRRVAFAAGDESREKALAAASVRDSLPDARHPVWSVLETGQPELLAGIDGPALATGGGDLRLFADLPVRSAMIVPLRPRGRTAGAIAFYSNLLHRFGPEEFALARELAARAAMAVDNARLYRASREAVRARDDVLAVVSHDLGNPLSAIRIGVSLLLRSHDAATGAGGGWEHLAGIKQSVEQMERLIRDLLDVKRIEAGQLTLTRKRLRPAALVDATVEMMMPLAASKGIEVRTAVEKPLPPIDADRERMIQALANLVGNAVKFAAPGGRVEIRCRPQDGEVVFAVADDGPGIEALDLAHIFDRYWQATRTRVEGGLGLGLAIVKGIVQAHGGRVWAESTPGNGTTVGFALRAAKPDAA